MKDYNKTIRELFGCAAKKGEVGLEIEVEGQGLIHGPVRPFWGYHEDGSLRGPENAEYVLMQPIERKLVPNALENLFTALQKQGSKLRKNSPNTSVHVHLNFQDVSLKQTYTTICTWYILEEALMEYCGAERTGNVFCLRGSDAEAQLQRLASAIRYGRVGDLNDPDGLRYSALNYTSLAKFGSLEFRGLGGVYDPKEIQIWVDILTSLKDFSLRFSDPAELLMEFSRSGPEEFLRMALRDGLWKHVETKDSGKQLRRGMRLIQNVAYCVAWDKEEKKRPLDDAQAVPEENENNPVAVDMIRPGREVRYQWIWNNRDGQIILGQDNPLNGPVAVDPQPAEVHPARDNVIRIDPPRPDPFWGPEQADIGEPDRDEPEPDDLGIDEQEPPMVPDAEPLQEPQRMRGRPGFPVDNPGLIRDWQIVNHNWVADHPGGRVAWSQDRQQWEFI